MIEQHLQTDADAEKRSILRDPIEQRLFKTAGAQPLHAIAEGTLAIEMGATLEDIIVEVINTRKSERENRVIDLGSDAAMEDKKKEGYF